MSTSGYINPIVYSPRGENGSQYDVRQFEPLSIVEARYIKSAIYPGNPFVEALPPAPSEEELAKSSTKSIDFNHDEIVKLPLTEQSEIIGQLKNLVRIYLPHYKLISNNIRECLLTAFSCRTFKVSDPHLEEVKDPTEVFQRTTSYSERGTCGGIYVIGSSGCGKTTGLDPTLAYYAQVMKHPLRNGGSFHQVVYLRVDCPEGNFSELYARIGEALDSALQTSHLKTFESMLKGKKGTTNAERASILAKLVESFAIGLIVLDESQNLQFSSAYDKSLTELLNVSNSTKVSFIFVGTSFFNAAYNMTEDRRKTVRRVGTEIVADRYCHNEACFRLIMAELSKYQLFEPEIDVLNNEEIMSEIRDFSHGVIELTVKLWTEMNKAYLDSGRTAKINGKFIRNIVNTKLYHQNLILDAEDRTQRKAVADKLKDALTKGFDWYTNTECGFLTDADRAIEPYLNDMRDAADQISDTMGGKGNYDNNTIRNAVIESAITLARHGKDSSKKAIVDGAVKLLVSPKSKR